MSQELRVDITGNSKGLQKAANKAKRALSALGQKAKGIGKNIQGALSNIKLPKLDQKFKDLGKTIAAAFAVREVVNFGKATLETAAKFERLGAVLENTLGDKSKAQVAMLKIQSFASKTPFQVDELTSSFVKLANQGFKPTVKEMTKLGDLASSQGKSFDQLTEAIIDAQVGEFERLKEFGVRAQKEGDRVTFTFKGVKQQVDFTSGSIRDYILSLGDAQGVTGGMDKISKTLGGRVSNLNDAYTQLQATLGNMATSDAGGVVGLFTDILHNINLTLKGVTKLKEELWLLKLDEAAAEGVSQYKQYLSELEKSLGKNFDLQSAQDSYISQLEESRKQTELNGNLDIKLKNDRLKLFEAEIHAIKEYIQLQKDSNLALKERQSLAAKPTSAATRVTGDVAPLADRTKPSVITTPTGAPGLPNADVTKHANYQASEYNMQLAEMTEKMARFREISESVGFTWENLGVQFTQVFTGMLENGTLTFKGLVTALIKLIAKLAIANVLANLLNAAFNPLGTAKGVQTISTISQVLAGGFASAIPGLANGGVVTSPTLALIGEGRESEAVLPLSKLDAMMQGGGGGYVETRIDGQDLILMIDRARRFNGRING